MEEDANQFSSFPYAMTNPLGLQPVITDGTPMESDEDDSFVVPDDEVEVESDYGSDDGDSEASFTDDDDEEDDPDYVDDADELQEQVASLTEMNKMLRDHIRYYRALLRRHNIDDTPRLADV